MNEEETFHGRLKRIRKSLGLSQKDFANGIHISGASLSEMEKGRHKPCHDFFCNITNAYNVNLYYLLLGEGEMFRIPMLTGDSDSGKGETENQLFELLRGDMHVDREDFRKMIYYFRRSGLLQYMMLGFFRQLFRRHKDDIEAEVDEYLRDKEE